MANTAASVGQLPVCIMFVGMNKVLAVIVVVVVVSGQNSPHNLEKGFDGELCDINTWPHHISKPARAPLCLEVEDPTRIK